MALKFVLFVALALLIQAAYGQCSCGNNIVASNINLGNPGIVLGNPGISAIGQPALGYNPGLIGVGNNVGVIGGFNGVSLINYPDLYNIGSSGPLVVSAISPIGPSGLAVASENVIEGTLLVNGALPFLSAVSFEGALPTAGSGIATCGCGNGAVGIISEGFPGPYPGPIGSAIGPIGPLGPFRAPIGPYY